MRKFFSVITAPIRFVLRWALPIVGIAKRSKRKRKERHDELIEAMRASHT